MKILSLPFLYDMKLATISYWACKALILREFLQSRVDPIENMASVFHEQEYGADFSITLCVCFQRSYT